MQKKPLMMIDSSVMNALHSGASAGINFHIVESEDGPYVVLQSGEAMPLFKHEQCFCLFDHLNGMPVQAESTTQHAMGIMKNYSGRADAVKALNRANISLDFMGGFGAAPLLGATILEENTRFYRFISSDMDFRYRDGKLSAETYVTTASDAAHVNTGFSVVARFALPLPLPANVRIEYEIPKGTRIQVGTVAPNFGQAGGGVEIFLPEVTGAEQVTVTKIPDF